MAVIALPTTSRFAKSIQWTLDRPAQVNRSAWTGKDQVIASPWHGRWSAKVELVPIVGETAVRPWRAFLAQLKGQINTFRLPATEGPQNAEPAVLTGGAAAGATTIDTFNWQAGGGTFKAGSLVTINDQLVVATQDLAIPAVPGTHVNLVFEPPLRAAAGGGSAIEVANPTCLVALTGSAIAWSVAPGKIYALGTLEVEERY